VQKFLQYRLQYSLLLSLLFLTGLPAITPRELLVSLSLFMSVCWICLFNITTDSAEDHYNNDTPLVNKLRLVRWIAYASLTGSLLLVLAMPKIFFTVLIFGGMIGFFYSYPVHIGKRSYRLKNIVLVKNLASTTMWVSLSCLPYYILFPDVPHILVFLKAVVIFFAALCLEIMGDVRDIDGDKKAGIKTLANTMGVAKTKAIALLIFAGYCLWFYHFTVHIFRPSPFLIFAQTSTFLMILFTTEKRPRWYFMAPVYLCIAFCLIILVGVYIMHVIPL